MLRNSLDGTRILDFSHVLAGPVCAMTLGDLGADVVKIEPPDGEIGRQIGPPFIGQESVVALSVNRNKRGLAIDLKTDAGRRVIREMVCNADVLLENFRPGVMATLGLDFASLQAINPRLVYCSISAFGQSGKSSRRPGVDGIVQAASGLMSTLGESGTAPVKVPAPVADMVGGYFATIAILGALTAARRDGAGAYLDISLFNATLMLQQIGYASHFATGLDPRRQGSAAPYAAPNEAYPTEDGWLMVVAYHPQRWVALCEVLDVPQLVEDTRFATGTDRVRHRDDLRSVLSARFATRTTVDWLPRLAARDILCAPVASYGEVVESIEYHDSGLDSHVDHPVAGRVRMPGFVLGPTDDRTHIDRPPPMVGQHSVEILLEYGFEPAAVADLVTGGAVIDGRVVSSTGDSAIGRPPSARVAVPHTTSAESC